MPEDEDEVTWLLQSQLPAAMLQIMTAVKEGIMACSCTSNAMDSPPPKGGVAQSNTSTSSSSRSGYSSTLAISSVSTDTVKGFVSMNGTHIIKGELTIKFKGHHHAKKIVINSSNPIDLIQIQTAKNCLVSILSMIQEFDTRPDSANRDNIIHDLERIIALSDKAQLAMTQLDEAHMFPNKICNQKCFVPELPDDLIIEFYVNNTSLISSICNISFHQHALQLQLQNKLLSTFKGPMKIDNYRGKPIEIVDEVLVESPSPRLVALMGSIDSINFLSKDLLSKLSLMAK